MVDCPELRDSATYKLNRFNPPGKLEWSVGIYTEEVVIPVGGVAMSTIIAGNVWPCDR